MFASVFCVVLLSAAADVVTGMFAPDGTPGNSNSNSVLSLWSQEMNTIREEALRICQTKGYHYEDTTGSCYKVHIEPRTWAEAHAVCTFEGGFLAVPNSAEKARVVSSLYPRGAEIPDRTWAKYYDPLFVGVRNWFNAGEWLGMHGERAVWDWHAGEPSTHIPEEYCTGLIGNGKLNNCVCSNKGFSICERDLMTILKQLLLKRLFSSETYLTTSTNLNV
ncbi:galactose-specific lectin nattectin-like [Anticarsia gemmatalis]|uniref:galactose-specific lectin nattectin-like n=1 Tax=Anticarsia gemmatalis TaxID=129554 RepID=UPI003F765F55